jgi:hypothetical protein
VTPCQRDRRDGVIVVGRRRGRREQSVLSRCYRLVVSVPGVWRPCLSSIAFLHAGGRGRGSHPKQLAQVVSWRAASGAQPQGPPAEA